MTDKDRELYEATTPGEWGVRSLPSIGGQFLFTEETINLAANLSVSNATWITHAHKRWPELLDEIERLKGEVRVARELLEFICEPSRVPEDWPVCRLGDYAKAVVYNLRRERDQAKRRIEQQRKTIAAGLEREKELAAGLSKWRDRYVQLDGYLDGSIV